MGEKIEHRIGVQAPAEVIWESLIDVASWPEWSVIYPRAEGVVRLGGLLELTLALPKREPREIKATVSDWVPHEYIHWSTRSRFGLVKTTRYLEIEALTETGCIVSNGEVVDGAFAEGFLQRNGWAMRAGFEQLNEALKARAEAAWRERQNATT